MRSRVIETNELRRSNITQVEVNVIDDFSCLFVVCLLEDVGPNKSSDISFSVDRFMKLKKNSLKVMATKLFKIQLHLGSMK